MVCLSYGGWEYSMYCADAGSGGGVIEVEL